MPARQVTKETRDGIKNFARIETTVACAGAITADAMPEIRKMGFVSVINLREAPEPGEDRTMPQSPKVATYDLQPEMAAAEVTEAVLGAIAARRSLAGTSDGDPSPFVTMPGSSSNSWKRSLPSAVIV